MKNLLFISMVVFLMASCTSRKTDVYTITGSIAGLADSQVLLQTRQGGEWMTLDSALAAGGSFEMNGTVKMPEMLYLQFKGVSGYVPLFVENTDISVTGTADSLEKVVITGSKSHDEYTAYNKLTEALSAQYYELSERYQQAKESGNEEVAKEIEKEYEVLDQKEKELILDHIAQHPSSVVSAYLARRNSYMFELEDLEKITAQLSPALDSSQYVKELRERVVVLKRVAIGQPAIDFTMADSLGNPVSLSSFKGKYLLVDFWASWCGPCRAENPNVVACYREFNAYGFEILGVSFDRNREDWLQAIKEDSLTWAHVSDLKYWENAAGKLYGVNAIPSNVLVDRNQTIIARNLRGEELRTKLMDLFSE